MGFAGRSLLLRYDVQVCSSMKYWGNTECGWSNICAVARVSSSLVIYCKMAIREK